LAQEAARLLREAGVGLAVREVERAVPAVWRAQPASIELSTGEFTMKAPRPRHERAAAPAATARGRPAAVWWRVMVGRGRRRRPCRHVQ